MGELKGTIMIAWKSTTPASRLYQSKPADLYIHKEVIKHFDVLWLDRVQSNLPCRYSLKYSCIHTDLTDWQCVWGWDMGAQRLCAYVCVCGGGGVHVHLAIGSIKAKLYSHFKALRRRQWSLLIPCQSAVSVHSPLNWRINERHQTGIHIAGLLCMILNQVSTHFS